jgi:FkbM family methyltransferase
MDKRFSIHHIGGRGGGGAFPVHARFERDLVLTFYEADPDCIEQIKERNAYLKSEVRVLPYCLGAGPGKATLHINYDPYTCSLLPANPDYRDYRCFVNYGTSGLVDYVLGDALRSMEQRQLSVVPLDAVCTGDRPGSQPPDFLSVDTEGSEYDILTGAARVLEQNTLAVALEVEFHPIFAGQKLFGDVCRLLAGHGFLFVGLARETSLWSPYDSSVSLRGKGIHLSDDAFFIRSVESVVASTSDERERCLKLSKLAFTAVVFGQMEIAAECLKRIEGSSAASWVRQELSDTEYGRFLAEFWQAIQRQPAYYPITFAQRFTFEASRSRFNTAGQRGVRWLELIRDWLVRKPWRWRLVHCLISPVLSAKQRLKLIGSLTAAAKPFWRHPALQWRTEIERVLRRYGLDEQEQTVRRNRRRYAAFSKERK